jgi:hypothetical protein
LFGLPRYVSCAPVQPAKEPAKPRKQKSSTIPHRTIQSLKIWEDGFVAEATLYLYLYLGLVRGLRLRGWGGLVVFRCGVEWWSLGMASLGRYRVCKATDEINLTYLTLLSLGELFNRDAMLSIALSLD